MVKNSEKQFLLLLQTLLTKIRVGLAIYVTELKARKIEILKVIQTNEIEVSQARILSLFSVFKEGCGFRY